MGKYRVLVVGLGLMGCATVVDDEDPFAGAAEDSGMNGQLPDVDGEEAGGDGSGGSSLVFSSGGTTFGSGGTDAGSGTGGADPGTGGADAATGGAATSTGGATMSSGGVTGSGGAPVGTGSCEGVPGWSSGSSADSVATCTASSQPCIKGGGVTGTTYKFTCTAYEPNCEREDPGSTNWADPPWTLVEECVD